MDKENLVEKLMEATGWTKEKTEDLVTNKTLDEFLSDLSSVWNSLNEDSKKQVSDIIGGQRKKEGDFKVLMDELNNAVNTTADSTNKVGTAFKSVAKKVYKFN